MSAPDNRPFFPPILDSSMMATFRSCPQKFFRQYVQHWKPKGESVHLVAGGAFAKGIEMARKAFFIDGVGAAEAETAGLQALDAAYGEFDCPDGSAKSKGRMLGALEYYFQNYPLGGDGAIPITQHGKSVGVEFSFALPLSIIHPQLGSPLLYTGRCDMVADFSGGVYIFDEKTTSALGPSWAKKWGLRSQFTGYAAALQEFGHRPVGVVVRGISILKTKYDTQQALSYRPQWMIDRWWQQLYYDIGRMIELWARGWWDFNLDDSCQDYGGCTFARLCESNTPESWLDMYYEQRVWDPCAHSNITVPDWESKWRK